MQDSSNHKSSTLDTSLPSVRMIQDIIREKRPVAIHMVGGLELEGRIQWQDLMCIGLRAGEVHEGEPPITLINRHQISLIRQLV